MKELESNYFSSKEAFRNWLVTNHDTSPGIWMIFYKTAQKNKMSESGFTGLNDLQDYGIGIIRKIGLILIQTFLMHARD